MPRLPSLYRSSCLLCTNMYTTFVRWGGHKWHPLLPLDFDALALVHPVPWVAHLQSWLSLHNPFTFRSFPLAWSSERQSAGPWIVSSWKMRVKNIVNNLPFKDKIKLVVGLHTLHSHSIPRWSRGCLSVREDYTHSLYQIVLLSSSLALHHTSHLAINYFFIQ